MPRPNNLPLLPAQAYENAMWWIKDCASASVPMSGLIRAERAVIARHRAAERESAEPYFSTFSDDGWSKQRVTAYAIDGIHPDAPHHRMFGPEMARSGRGPANEYENGHHGQTCRLCGSTSR